MQMCGLANQKHIGTYLIDHCAETINLSRRGIKP